MNMVFKPIVTSISSTSWSDNWFWSQSWIESSEWDECAWSENWFLEESASRHWTADIFESSWI